MSLEGFIEHREDQLSRARGLAARDSAARSWMIHGTSEAARLLRFDGWVRLELEARIDWTWAGPLKARRVEQCKVELENLVLALWRRGWMLDGSALAGHIRDALDDVGAAQKAGRVREFWPFFKSVVNRYVGINAEEIRTEAMSLGAHVGQVFQRLSKPAVGMERAMPELLAQRRREQEQISLTARLAQERRDQTRHEAEKAQLPLL